MTQQTKTLTRNQVASHLHTLADLLNHPRFHKFLFRTETRFGDLSGVCRKMRMSLIDTGMQDCARVTLGSRLGEFDRERCARHCLEFAGYLHDLASEIQVCALPEKARKFVVPKGKSLLEAMDERYGWQGELPVNRVMANYDSPHTTVSLQLRENTFAARNFLAELSSFVSAWVTLTRPSCNPVYERELAARIGRENWLAKGYPYDILAYDRVVLETIPDHYRYWLIAKEYCSTSLRSNLGERPVEKMWDVVALAQSKRRRVA